MKRFMEILKQVFAGIGAAAVAVVLFLLGRGSAKKDSSKKRPFDYAQGDNDLPVGSMSDCLTEEKIEEKCNEKRNETLERLANSDARKLSETYGTVCDAITDGKLRFRKRCNSGASSASATGLDS